MAGGKARKLYHEFRDDADKRYQTASRNQALGGFLGNALGAAIQNHQQDQQNQALLGFLAQRGQPVGGTAAAPGGTAAAPQQQTQTQSPVLGFLQSNPAMARSQLGQSLIQQQLASLMTPQINIEGLGSVPMTPAGINAWSSLQSNKAAADRLASGQAFDAEQARLAGERADTRLGREYELRKAELGQRSEADETLAAMKHIQAINENSARAAAEAERYGLDRESRERIASIEEAGRDRRLGQEWEARADQAVLEGRLDRDLEEAKARLRPATGGGDSGANYRDIRKAADTMRTRIAELKGLMQGYESFDSGPAVLNDRQKAGAAALYGDELRALEARLPQLEALEQQLTPQQPQGVIGTFLNRIFPAATAQPTATQLPGAADQALQALLRRYGQ